MFPVDSDTTSRIHSCGAQVRAPTIAHEHQQAGTVASPCNDIPAVLRNMLLDDVTSLDAFAESLMIIHVDGCAMQSLHQVSHIFSVHGWLVGWLVECAKARQELRAKQTCIHKVDMWNECSGKQCP